MVQLRGVDRPLAARVVRWAGRRDPSWRVVIEGTHGRAVVRERDLVRQLPPAPVAHGDPEQLHRLVVRLHQDILAIRVEVSSIKGLMEKQGHPGH